MIQLSMLVVFAVLLGALACGFLTYDFFERKSRAAHRSTIRKRLQDVLSKGENEVSAHALVRRIPFLSQRLALDVQKRAERTYRVELPKMFEIVSLGLRVGLAFDQAFALYARGFPTPLAAQCRERLEIWERGLISREAGLRDLAVHIGLKEFDRFVSLALQALAYGAPLTQLLGDLADDVRKAYRAERQEMVAKAPVKMLLPTGVFILPAMMMLVIGPIILDVTERMV